MTYQPPHRPQWLDPANRGLSAQEIVDENAAYILGGWSQAGMVPDTAKHQKNLAIMEQARALGSRAAWYLGWRCDVFWPKRAGSSLWNPVDPAWIMTVSPDVWSTRAKAWQDAGWTVQMSPEWDMATYASFVDPLYAQGLFPATYCKRDDATKTVWIHDLIMDQRIPEWQTYAIEHADWIRHGAGGRFKALDAIQFGIKASHFLKVDPAQTETPNLVTPTSAQTLGPFVSTLMDGREYAFAISHLISGMTKKGIRVCAQLAATGFDQSEENAGGWGWLHIHDRRRIWFQPESY